MIVNFIKYSLLTLVLLLLATLLAGHWLTGTASGSRWLWERAGPLIPGKLEAESIGGSIGSGLDLSGVSYASQGIDVDIRQARVAAKLVLFPLAIDVRELRAEGAVIRKKETESPDEPGEPILEKLALPFAINAEAISVRDLQVLDSAGERIFAVGNAELAGSWHEEISLTRVRLGSGAGSLEGALRLGLAKPHTASASIGALYPLRLDDGSVRVVRITANAQGSLADLRIDVSSAEPTLQVVGNLFNLTGQPGWDVRVQTPQVQWPLATNPDRPPQVYLRQVDLETSGDLSAYSIAGDGKVSVAGTGELQFVLSADGNREGLEVTGLQLQGDMLEAESIGEVRWADGLSIAADADVARFDVNVLTPKWPAENPVSGTVDAAWSPGKVELNEVGLRVLDAATTVDATGEIDLDGGVVDLDLDWRELRWPMAEQSDDATTRFLSEFGQVNVSGRPEAWAFDGRIAFRAAELPQGIFVLSGTGNRDGVEATLSDSEVLDGRASGRGSYTWAEDGRWSAELVTENLNIAPLSRGLPGQISSDFAAQGQLKPLQFAVDIRRLEGVIRDKPLTGEGGLRYVDGNLNAEQLRITSGESQLQADGSLKSESGLDFTLDVAALEMFHPATAGSVQANGNLSMSGPFPTVRIDLQGQELYWGDYALQELTLTSAGQDAGMPISLEASGNMLSIGTREVERFSVQLAAGPTRQGLQVNLSSGDKEIGFELDGRLEDWRHPLESVWTGQLRSAGFSASEDVRFTLSEPAGIRLATDLVSLGQTCLDGNADSRVCIDGSWTGGAGVDVAAQMISVPVDLVGLLYETELDFTQTLSGSLSIREDAGSALSGEGQINISPGRIQNRNKSRMATQTGAGVLHFNLVGGQLLTGRLTLPFSESAEIDAGLEVADISAGKASPIEGQLVVDLHDIAVLANISPMIDEARGRLDVDLSIAGTVGNPLFAGDASLRGGALRYEPLGLYLTDVELQSVMHANNRIDLQGTFRAGEGIGELKSSAASINGLRNALELSLTGQNLTLIDLPDINVVADTDLRIGIQSETLTINGNILIPRARLSPVNLTSARISESEDVVVVANRDSEVAAEEGNRAPFEFAGTVALVLGKDVLVDLDVAEARLSGTSAFRWNGPPMPVANGQYNIAGRFEAYGQLLEITEGSIQFPGIPASNPNLRIRAEREIFGNPQIRSAGVLITGTANEPVVVVYTNPPTTRDRAVTLLVTGSDFNYEQGVGAVDVGTYIAPKLFVSYGIGLFDRGSVISVRYDFVKGFGIKATSGKNADGVDLSYTVER